MSGREGIRLRRALACLAVLLLLSPVLQASEAEAEVEFTKGQQAFEQGDYHKALRYFRAARRSDPPDAEYAHWEGATLLRLRRFRDAVGVLGEARDLAGGELPGLDYDLGVAQYNLREFEAAEASLRESLRQDPSNTRARLFLGLTLHEQGNTDEAIAELERARSEAPEMAGEIGLVLGRVYAETGRTEEAARELRAAATVEDRQIAEISRDYLREIEIQAGGPPKRWNFQGYAAVDYDTNVVLNPQDPGVDFPVSQSEDFRTVWFGRVFFNPLANRSTTFGFSYGFYQSLHEDLTEFDFQGHLPEVHVAWTNGRVGYDGSLEFQYYLVDSQDYLRRWEATNGFSFLEGSSGRTRIYYRYRDDDFFDVPERDGNENYVGVTQAIFPWKTKRRFVQVGAGYGDREAGNDFTYKTRTADALFFAPMGEVWYFYAALLYSNYDYDLPDSVFGTVRNDDEWEIVFRTTYELAEHWNLIGEYHYTEHRSNIPFFDYKRQIITVGVTTAY